jgi:hypothetical protein
MAFTEEAFRDQIPYYLTQPQKQALAAAISEFVSTAQAKPFTVTGFAEELLQGDGWKGLQLFEFESGERRHVRGMIISNSCDIDPQNVRDYPPNLTFVPIVRLDKIKQIWLGNGVKEERIAQKFSDIRAQRVTEFFYIPEISRDQTESIAVLSDAHSMPAGVFQNSPVKKKLFSLSQVAFYLLLFKLSINFCRMHEGISRFDSHAGNSSSI